MTDPLAGLLAGLTDDQVADLVASLPEPVITAMTRAGASPPGSAPPGRYEVGYLVVGEASEEAGEGVTAGVHAVAYRGRFVSLAVLPCLSVAYRDELPDEVFLRVHERSTVHAADDTSPVQDAVRRALPVGGARSGRHFAG